jgi:hypothetical protein
MSRMSIFQGQVGNLVRHADPWESRTLGPSRIRFIYDWQGCLMPHATALMRLRGGFGMRSLELGSPRIAAPGSFSVGTVRPPGSDPGASDRLHPTARALRTLG